VLYHRMANYSKKDKVCKKCRGEVKRMIKEDPKGFYLFGILNGEILKESKEKEDGRAWGCNRRAN
jgi:predicted DCC family thiol-disulfide oxidoreductase YuxK